MGPDRYTQQRLTDKLEDGHGSRDLVEEPHDLRSVVELLVKGDVVLRTQPAPGENGHRERGPEEGRV